MRTTVIVAIWFATFASNALATDYRRDSSDENLLFGIALLSEGHYVAAKAHLVDSLESHPAYEDLKKAMVQLEKKGKNEKTKKINMADRDRYGLLLRCYLLGKLTATCVVEETRDGRFAVDMATNTALLLPRGSAISLDLTAAACAEHGLFEEAVKFQTPALNRLLDESLRDRFHERLLMYKDESPLRLGEHGNPSLKLKNNRTTRQTLVRLTFGSGRWDIRGVILDGHFASEKTVEIDDGVLLRYTFVRPTEEADALCGIFAEYCLSSTLMGKKDEKLIALKSRQRAALKRQLDNKLITQPRGRWYSEGDVTLPAWLYHSVRLSREGFLEFGVATSFEANRKLVVNGSE